MAKAGSREQEFKRKCESICKEILQGKIAFKNEDGIYVSVDNSIILENQVILIEIDASNQAKLIAGQYTLLNLLQSKPMPNCIDFLQNRELIFLVLHCYGNKMENTSYNPERSRRNLELINNELFNGRGMRFGTLHWDDLNWKELRTRDQLFKKLQSTFSCANEQGSPSGVC